MLASVYFYEKMFLYKKEGNLSTFGKKQERMKTVLFVSMGEHLQILSVQYFAIVTNLGRSRKIKQTLQAMPIACNVSNTYDNDCKQKLEEITVGWCE